MTQTLREFIDAREREAAAQIKALNAELRELRAAKSAIDADLPAARQRPASSRVTHREMIIDVLDARPDGGTSDRVIEWVKEQFGVEISQASISSQLSRAKSDGLISLDHATKVWRSIKHSAVEDGNQADIAATENPASAGAGEANTGQAASLSGVHNPNFDRAGQ